MDDLKEFEIKGMIDDEGQRLTVNFDADAPMLERRSELTMQEQKTPRQMLTSNETILVHSGGGLNEESAGKLRNRFNENTENILRTLDPLTLEYVLTQALTAATMKIEDQVLQLEFTEYGPDDSGNIVAKAENGGFDQAALAWAVNVDEDTQLGVKVKEYNNMDPKPENILAGMGSGYVYDYLEILNENLLPAGDELEVQGTWATIYQKDASNWDFHTELIGTWIDQAKSGSAIEVDVFAPLNFTLDFFYVDEVGNASDDNLQSLADCSDIIEPLKQIMNPQGNINFTCGTRERLNLNGKKLNMSVVRSGMVKLQKPSVGTAVIISALVLVQGDISRLMMSI